MTLSGGSPLMKGSLGVAYAVAGDRAAAERTLRELETLRAESYASALDIADIHVALGDRERAFGWLDQAAEERAFHLIYLKVWPELDPLRSNVSSAMSSSRSSCSTNFKNAALPITSTRSTYGVPVDMNMRRRPRPIVCIQGGSR